MNPIPFGWMVYSVAPFVHTTQIKSIHSMNSYTGTMSSLAICCHKNYTYAWRKTFVPSSLPLNVYTKEKSRIEKKSVSSFSFRLRFGSWSAFGGTFFLSSQGAGIFATRHRFTFAEDLDLSPMSRYVFCLLWVHLMPQTRKNKYGTCWRYRYRWSQPSKFTHVFLFMWLFRLHWWNSWMKGVG